MEKCPLCQKGFVMLDRHYAMSPDCHQYSLRRQQVPEYAAVAAPPVIAIAANDVSLSPLLGTEVCIPVSTPSDGTQTRNSKRQNEESMVFGNDLSECTFSPQKKNKPATTCTSSQDLPARGITGEADTSKASSEDISKEEPPSETQNEQGATSPRCTVEVGGNWWCWKERQSAEAKLSSR